MRGLLIATAALTCANPVLGQNEATTEFGTIDWQRDYTTATAAAKKSGKPMLLLFQEVPG